MFTESRQTESLLREMNIICCNLIVIHLLTAASENGNENIHPMTRAIGDQPSWAGRALQYIIVTLGGTVSCSQFSKVSWKYILMNNFCCRKIKEKMKSGTRWTEYQQISSPNILHHFFHRYGAYSIAWVTKIRYSYIKYVDKTAIPLTNHDTVALIQTLLW
jgi:hypothetical protein